MLSLTTLLNNAPRLAASFNDALAADPAAQMAWIWVISLAFLAAAVAVGLRSRQMGWRRRNLTLELLGAAWVFCASAAFWFPWWVALLASSVAFVAARGGNKARLEVYKSLASGQGDSPPNKRFNLTRRSQR